MLLPARRHRSSWPWLVAFLLALQSTSVYTFLFSSFSSTRRNLHLLVSSESSLEKDCRRLAIDSLLPFFFRQRPSPQDDDTTADTTSSVSVEKALKRALRSLSKHDAQYSLEEQRWKRHRLAELVLGTCVWRRKYEYLVNTTTTMMTDTDSTLSDDYHKTAAIVDWHIQAIRNDFCLPKSIIWPSDPIERLSVQYSLPVFLIRLLMDQYGFSETEALCQTVNHPGPITIRRNRVLCDSDERLMESLKNDGVTARPLLDVFLTRDNSETVNPVWKPPKGCLRLVPTSSTTAIPAKTPSFWNLSTWKTRGWLEVQDVGSQLIVQAMQVEASDAVIVDFCAGNGGKTLALASQVHATQATTTNTTSPPCKTTIWSHDIVEERLRHLRGSLKRAGLLDHASIAIRTTSNHTQDLTDNMADIVLVDAPCSSSGALRRRPSQRWSIQEDDILTHLPATQLDILRSAARLVKLRGRLVYATCSILQHENEHVARMWEKEMGDEWVPWEFETNKWPSQPHTAQSETHYRGLLPHIHDSDGFFIARWRRK